MCVCTQTLTHICVYLHTQYTTCIYMHKHTHLAHTHTHTHTHTYMHMHTHSRYFTEDVPVLLFTSLPFCLLGVWQCPTHWSRAPFWLALWELIVHSALSHKEHRYVLPIVPIASLYAGTYQQLLYHTSYLDYLQYITVEFCDTFRLLYC